MKWNFGFGLSPLIKRSSDSWSSYWTRQSEFFLDGTIITVGSDKYFKDKSVNGRNFLITGYDFASDWTTGFPYKSAATISAPAGDAALIAADINNFLYDAGGTPNAIPVVSLFQDIDYEHKIFCKHAAQIVDDNGVETYEPRVSHIFMAAEVLSGDDLAKAYTDFGVTAESATALWVAKTGNDTTGNGTKAAPFLTIYKAEETAAANGTVYVKTGLYIENHTGTTGYLAINKAIIIQPLGFNLIRAVSTGQILVPFGGGATNTRLYNSVVGNASAVTYTVYVIAAGILSILKSWIQKGNYIFRAENATAINLTNTILSGATNRVINVGTAPVVIDSCYVNNSTTTTIVQAGVANVSSVVKNSRATGIALSMSGNPDIQIYGNKVAGSISVGTTAAVNAADKCIIKNNVVTINGTAVQVESDLYDTQILSNAFIAPTGSLLVEIYDQTSVVVSNNLLLAATGANGGYWFRATTAVGKALQFNNNRIHSKNGYTPIQVGNESIPDGYNTYSGSIYGNRILGENSIASHGVVAFRQNGVNIKWNFVTGYTFGFIVKTLGSDLSAAPMMYNISKECVNGISAKGGDGQYIVNNTVINPTGNGFYSAYNPDGDGYGSINTVFKNNIIINNTDTAIKMINHDAYCTMVSDYNIFYDKNGDYSFVINGVDKTRAEWLAAGHDAHSIFLTDEQFAGLFNDFDNEDYSLKAGSVAIGAGETLDAAYDDGLDASTAWGDDNTCPVVVTKQQGAEWDCGAYVH